MTGQKWDASKDAQNYDSRSCLILSIFYEGLSLLCLLLCGNSSAWCPNLHNDLWLVVLVSVSSLRSTNAINTWFNVALVIIQKGQRRTIRDLSVHMFHDASYSIFHSRLHLKGWCHSVWSSNNRIGNRKDWQTRTIGQTIVRQCRFLRSILIKYDKLICVAAIYASLKSGQ